MHVVNILSVFSKCQIVLLSGRSVGCSKIVWFQICIYTLYSRGNDIWVKQCSIMCETLTYSIFGAFDFTFDMVLYYI